MQTALAEAALNGKDGVVTNLLKAKADAAHQDERGVIHFKNNYTITVTLTP
jgi:ankyrin repeat protein